MNAATTFLGEFPRWAAMWLLAGALFFAGKAAMLRGARLRGWRLAGFTCAWAGMDPVPFRERNGTTSGKRRPHEAGRPFALPASLANIALGSALLWGAARHFEHPLAAGWVGMTGLIFVLHFGLFSLLAVLWNAAGMPVSPIMRCPVAAISLAEFWGRRWNLAFRDLTHVLVFRPTACRWGHNAALWASFTVSGLAHELVISVPAGASFGLPTGYFLLQALGITLERKVVRTRRVRNEEQRLSRRERSTLWLRTHAFTALPAFLLFHPPFVERVMVPFFHVIKALP